MIPIQNTSKNSLEDPSSVRRDDVKSLRIKIPPIRIRSTGKDPARVFEHVEWEKETPKGFFAAIFDYIGELFC